MGRSTPNVIGIPEGSPGRAPVLDAEAAAPACPPRPGRGEIRAARRVRQSSAEAASICSNPTAIPAIHSSIRAILTVDGACRRGRRGRALGRRASRCADAARVAAVPMPWHGTRCPASAGSTALASRTRRAGSATESNGSAISAAAARRPYHVARRRRAPAQKISDQPCRAQHQGALERRACQNRPRRCGPVTHFICPLSWLSRSFPTYGPVPRASTAWRPRPAAPRQSVPPTR